MRDELLLEAFDPHTCIRVPLHTAGLAEALTLTDQLLVPYGWVPRFPTATIRPLDRSRAKAVITSYRFHPPVPGQRFFVELRAAVLAEYDCASLAEVLDLDSDIQTLITFFEQHRPFEWFTGEIECREGTCSCPPDTDHVRPDGAICTACTPVDEGELSTGARWFPELGAQWPCLPVSRAADQYRIALPVVGHG